MSTRRRFTIALCIAVSLIPLGLSAQAPNGWIQNTQWLLLGPLGNQGGCDPGASMSSNWIAPWDIASIVPFEEEPMEIDFGSAASTGWLGAGDSPAWVRIGAIPGVTADDTVDVAGACALLGASAGKAIPVANVAAVLATYITNGTDGPVAVDVLASSGSDRSSPPTLPRTGWPGRSRASWTGDRRRPGPSSSASPSAHTRPARPLR